MIRCLLILCMLSACVPVKVTVGSGEPTRRAIATNAVQDATFDRLLNAQRAAVGTAAVTPNAQLAAAAKAHAADMNARNYFSHRTPEGQSSGDRAARFGVPACGLGENIAQGQGSSAEVFEGWMQSAGHRRNMLNKIMTHYGLGVDGKTWVLMLYTPC